MSDTFLFDLNALDEVEPRRGVDAVEIADALGKPHPTAEQRAVIESPLEPALVVAGAGSGKTETMANRVLWLLANGRVRPSEVLGLTFTRKAAGELGERITERIAQLGRAGLLPTEPGGEPDPFEAPTVSTYNAFANTIFRDNAVLIGREGDATVLSEASAWHLARGLVIDSDDESIGSLDKGVDQLTDVVIALAHDLSDNLADPAAVARFAEEFIRIEQLPRGGRGSGSYADVRSAVTAVGALPVLTRLATRFQQAKAERGFVEFADQVALALDIVGRVPRVARELRQQYRVVLLDEYQDTSVMQTRLLSQLFRGHGVMAVGDPHQSIYGWRGASAANLGRFAVDFRAASGASYTLRTSWRNGHAILDAANTIVAPLSAASPVRVESLVAGPVASHRPIDLVFPETIDEEAETVADWFLQRLNETGAGEQPPSAAMLFRVRAHMERFAGALGRRGIPFHILGIGGLLRQPEIVDLVCALTVIDDPAAGSELLRLLAGSRWRIGVRDLRALRDLASWLAARDHAQRLLAPEVRERMRASVTEGEGGSIVEALDFIASRRDDDHSAFAEFSAEGLRRLRDAGELFARLRARTGLDLLDLVTLVEQELDLDVEVAANESRSDGRANLEAFLGAAADYLQADDRGGSGGASLRGFLRWLVLADKRDGISPRPEDPQPGTVQLLTIHGSKGLEWDLVAVPRLVEGESPSRPKEGSNGWLRFGGMPFAFRGDAAEVPDLRWRTLDTQKDFVDEKERFAAELLVRHIAEERRLAYVAVTRARHHLLLSGSWWAGQTKPRGPGLFLRDLESAGVIGTLPVEPADAENPLQDDARTFRWPHDPLGERGPRVRRAAELVRSAPPSLEGPLGAELALLLAEREARLRAAEYVVLPARVPASRFKDIVSEPATVAAQLRRPMPERPYRQTRLGTMFHSWVENRYGIRGAAEAVDVFPDEIDGFDESRIDDDGMRALMATFERSEWAGRRPDAVEIEIHLELAGHIVVCKLDAVYETAGGYQIVDWKTGRAPKDARDLELKQFQLALYRLAFAQWRGIPVESIDAVFYFVADDLVVRPERFYSERELSDALSSATGSKPRP
ncbi:UvrD-helicase domain-containing protein [Microbacteriaceae bacterium VKM Ac-2855]|nr:UvrD-helicase domain-containing protein [Microbacteriaceae bacterium VKM Ac-2855]